MLRAGVESASGRLGLSDADRRQLLYLDEVRRGTADADRLFDNLGGSAWQVDWATDTDLDPRLFLKLHVGPVEAMAWGEVSARPHIAVSTRELGDHGVDARYRLRVWDVLSGKPRTLPSDEPSSCLAFAMVADNPVLVSGHASGLLRIWNAVDGTILSTVRAGRSHLVDLYVADTEGLEQVVTLDAEGRVRCWSLSSGDLVRELDAPRPFGISGALLPDGRHTLVSWGDGLALWDLGRGERAQMRMPQDWKQPRAVTMSSVQGVNVITVVDSSATIITFDAKSGMQASVPITAHRVYRPNGRNQVWTGSYPHPKMAVVSGTLAVPTPSRVHLWDLATSQEKAPPIAGPVGHSTTARVQWQGRDLLLTGSRDDGVVALWDLGQRVKRARFHDQPVSNVAMAASTDVVVSVDTGGTVVARVCASGRLVTGSLATEIEDTRALEAWVDNGEIIAATGAGSSKVPDGHLRLWNLTRGARIGVPILAHLKCVHWLSRVRIGDDDVLATIGPGGMLKLWRTGDGELIAEVQTGLTSRVTGFATGLIKGRPAVALSTAVQPIRVQMLDDLAARPIIIPEAARDTVLALAGPYIVTAHSDAELIRPNAYRVWHILGTQVSQGITSQAEITAAAVRAWPAVYIARADGTVSLSDVATGRDLCAPMLLPSKANALTVVGNGDLVVGFGSDVARIRPPVV